MRFRLRTIRTFAVLCRLQRLHYPECFAESSELSVIRLLTLSSAVRCLCSILWSPSTCWDWSSWRRPVRSSSLCLRGNRSCPSSPCWWRRCTAQWAWLTRSCVCTSACCGGMRSPNSCEAASRTWEVAGSIPDTSTPTLTAHHTDWQAEVSVPLSNSILLFRFIFLLLLLWAEHRGNAWHHILIFTAASVSNVSASTLNTSFNIRTNQWSTDRSSGSSTLGGSDCVWTEPAVCWTTACCKKSTFLYILNVTTFCTHQVTSHW